MKTMNRDKSEELFNEIRRIEMSVMHLGGYVQNPDFVNENNAERIYQEFAGNYHEIISRLEELRVKMLDLHKDIIK